MIGSKLTKNINLHSQTLFLSTIAMQTFGNYVYVCCALVPFLFQVVDGMPRPSYDVGRNNLPVFAAPIGYPRPPPPPPPTTYNCKTTGVDLKAGVTLMGNWCSPDSQTSVEVTDTREIKLSSDTHGHISFKPMDKLTGAGPYGLRLGGPDSSDGLVIVGQGDVVVATVPGTEGFVGVEKELHLQDDGNLVLYAIPCKRALWSMRFDIGDEERAKIRQDLANFCPDAYRRIPQKKVYEIDKSYPPVDYNEKCKAATGYAVPERMDMGQGICSPSKQEMLKLNENALVLLGVDGQVKWQNTFKATSPVYLNFTPKDGLVVRNKAGKIVHRVNGTQGFDGVPQKIILQDDGNLVMYATKCSRPLWGVYHDIGDGMRNNLRRQIGKICP